MALPTVIASPRTTPPPVRRLRRPALVCAGALVAALGMVSPATAHEVTMGDTHVIPLPEVAERTVHLVYTCDTSTGEPTDCTPKQQTTPGTKAVLLKLVWSFAGAAEGAVATLEHPVPAGCKGLRGVGLSVASTGGAGEARLAGWIVEQNGVTGSTSEQLLFDESKTVGSDGGQLARVICLPPS